MQVLKEEVRKRIFDAGVEVFFRKGYQKAKMKEIADRAGVPVGLLYSYYRNKEALLDEVVKPVYRVVEGLLEDTDHSHEDFGVFLHDEIPIVLDLVTARRKQSLILFAKCQGTKYEKAKEKVIDLAKKHIKECVTGKQRNGEGIDDMFFHIAASSFVEGIVEIAQHYKNDAWAKKMVELLARHHLYGITGL